MLEFDLTRKDAQRTKALRLTNIWNEQKVNKSRFGRLATIFKMKLIANRKCNIFCYTSADDALILLIMNAIQFDINCND